jgi:hypothetical protein
LRIAYYTLQLIQQALINNSIKNEDMENEFEKIVEGLKQKFTDYDDNKEEIKKDYPSLYEVIEYYEEKVVEKKEQEFIEKNVVMNYHLKKYFGLLTEEEIQRQDSVDNIRTKYMGISYELFVDMRKDSTEYFDDVKVLLTYDYPYYLAYKIGNSIDDSEFIECSLYTNDIYKIIDIFLKTGQKIHDV